MILRTAYVLAEILGAALSHGHGQPTQIVEALEVIEHVGPGVVARSVDLVGGALGLERGEEASIAALSQTLPECEGEHVKPCSAIRLWHCSLVYWADSTGRRNILCVGRFKQCVKGLEVITPDADSQAAMGTNQMDLATRIPAARAGFAQGQLGATRLTFL